MREQDSDIERPLSFAFMSLRARGQLGLREDGRQSPVGALPSPLAAGTSGRSSPVGLLLGSQGAEGLGTGQEALTSAHYLRSHVVESLSFSVVQSLASSAERGQQDQGSGGAAADVPAKAALQTCNRAASQQRRNNAAFLGPSLLSQPPPPCTVSPGLHASSTSVDEKNSARSVDDENSAPDPTRGAVEQSKDDDDRAQREAVELQRVLLLVRKHFEIAAENIKKCKSLCASVPVKSLQVTSILEFEGLVAELLDLSTNVSMEATGVKQLVETMRESAAERVVSISPPADDRGEKMLTSREAAEAPNGRPDFAGGHRSARVRSLR